MGGADSHVLRNGKRGGGIWNFIGQDNQKRSSVLDIPSIQDYMTYDEIKLAALLQVSSFVKPINSGSRYNIGNPNFFSINFLSKFFFFV